ncbi:hypothetical protein JAAARDRAFT_27825 [Jaapia argillacea MUCL 33604]|uniref:Glutamyl-tRNA(Gln) amidotransferase subunit B, mitochondrial n=1 Tax=Jaapia argillacea MUCL 33604 TaxID=933084 RepID=A0A067QB54_9AGAM|nr:hypothetical protein JAAARDRAFT_27825 [Jaapia argillacea MUCL 33604]
MFACRRRGFLPRSLHHVRLAHIVRVSKEDVRWPGWEVVIGLEVHAQIKSRAKLFSVSRTSGLLEEPNKHVSPFDAAFPGTLPKLNPKCVDLTLRAATALNADVQLRSSFDRKHYFYADLPMGYQITQHYAPIATGGYVRLHRGGVNVRVKQIQIEQDTGKSTFDPRRRVSSIDLNRAGTGLMEIVSEPDMRSPEEAAEYIRLLQAILRSVGSSDGNMEQGSLRCDVNVSVNRPGDAPGTRCEIKNLNGIKSMQVAITASEVFRQISLVENGELVRQETRGFDEAKAETFSLRSKEDAPDYRYMPDPNLPPLLLDETYINQIRSKMPELPDTTSLRLHSQGLTQRDTEVLMTVDAGREVGFDGELGQGAVAYFDALSRGRDPKVVVNWITHELLGQLAARNQSFNENSISVEQMGDLIDLVQNGIVTGTAGKTLLRHMLSNPSSVLSSVQAKDLGLLALQSSESSELENWCKESIAAMPSESEAARKGNKNVVNKLVGRVMKLSRGRVDAGTVRQALEVLLKI